MMEKENGGGSAAAGPAPNEVLLVVDSMIRPEAPNSKPRALPTPRLALHPARAHQSSNGELARGGGAALSIRQVSGGPAESSSSAPGEECGALQPSTRAQWPSRFSAWGDVLNPGGESQQGVRLRIVEKMPAPEAARKPTFDFSRNFRVTAKMRNDANGIGPPWVVPEIVKRSPAMKQGCDDGMPSRAKSQLKTPSESHEFELDTEPAQHPKLLAAHLQAPAHCRRQWPPPGPMWTRCSPIFKKNAGGDECKQDELRGLPRDGWMPGNGPLVFTCLPAMGGGIPAWEDSPSAGPAGGGPWGAAAVPASPTARLSGQESEGIRLALKPNLRGGEPPASRGQGRRRIANPIQINTAKRPR